MQNAKQKLIEVCKNLSGYAGAGFNATKLRVYLSDNSDTNKVPDQVDGYEVEIIRVNRISVD